VLPTDSSISLLAYLHNILPKLNAPKRYGTNGWRAHCPAHDDHESNLRTRVDSTGSIVRIRCLCGCSQEDILRALGLTEADLQSIPNSDPQQSTAEIPSGPNADPDSSTDTNESTTNASTDPVDSQTTTDNPTTGADVQAQHAVNGNGHAVSTTTTSLPVTAKTTDPAAALRPRGLTPEDVSRYGLQIVSPQEAEASGFGKSAATQSASHI